MGTCVVGILTRRRVDDAVGWFPRMERFALADSKLSCPGLVGFFHPPVCLAWPCQLLLPRLIPCKSAPSYEKSRFPSCHFP